MITCEHCGSGACLVSSPRACRHTDKLRAAVPATSTTTKTTKTRK